MLGFKKFLNAQVGQQRVEDHIVINNLLQRVGESVGVEDRRDALQQLCNALTDDPAAQSAFASVGFPTICSAIQNDLDDSVVVRTGLEVIALAVAAEQAHDQQSARAAAVNAEQFARTDGAITLLLALLEIGSADAVHIRFIILQILHSLLDANTLFAQQAILKVPTGVSQIVEMIGESEVMRNEALLILQRLVAGNPDAQKVAVFCGCLDKIFSVLREEDYVAGGIVVLDCLQLASSLLKGNLHNQRMYRELGYEKILQHVLQTECQALLAATEVAVSEERCNNIAAVIDVVETCVGDGAGIEKSGLIPTLATWAAWTASAPWIRAAAWRCLATTAAAADSAAGAAVAGHSTTSNTARLQTLEKHTVEVSPTMKLPLVQAAIHEAFITPAAKGRAAAIDFFSTVASPSTQLSTLKNLFNFPEAGNPVYAVFLGAGGGGSLDELIVSSRAAAALHPLIVGNDAAKQQLQQQQQVMGPSSSLLNHQQQQQQHSSSSILDACAQKLAISVTKFGGNPEGRDFLIANFGVLLVAWLPKNPVAVQQFLQSISKTPFLVGAVMTENQFGDGSAVIRGVCAVLLGLCIMYAPPQSAVDPKILLKAAVEQITLERYCFVLDKFSSVLRAVTGVDEGSVLGSSTTAAWLVEVVGEVQKGVVHLASSGGDADFNNSLQKGSPRASTQQAIRGIPPSSPLNTGSSSSINGGGYLPQQPGSNREDYRPPNGTASPRSTAAAAAATTTTQNSTFPGIDPAAFKALQLEVQQLKAQNVQHQKEAIDVQSEAERLQQALNKAEADLEALSNAYTALDSHATELQARLDKALASQQQIGNGDRNSDDDIEALLQAAREEAEQDANAAMEDLLVCLGQEEAKVQQLEALLEEAKSARN